MTDKKLQKIFDKISNQITAAFDSVQSSVVEEIFNYGIDGCDNITE